MPSQLPWRLDHVLTHMKRTEKYAIGFGLTALVINGLAELICACQFRYLYVLAANITWPARIVSSLHISSDKLWFVQDSQITHLINDLCLNTLIWLVLGVMIAWSTPALTRKHRKRIRRYGLWTAILFGGVTLIFNLLVVFQIINLTGNSTWFFLDEYLFQPGELQAMVNYQNIIPRLFFSKIINFQYIFYNVLIWSVIGLIAGCLLAAFTSRWAKLPNDTRCPKCDYDLRATPQHCPECGWIPHQGSAISFLKSGINRMAKHTITGIILLLVGLTVGTVLGITITKNLTPPEVEVAANIQINDPQALKIIMARIKALQWPDENGQIYTLNNEFNPNQNITLTGQTPFELPDDHGHTTFRLLDISNNKA